MSGTGLSSTKREQFLEKSFGRDFLNALRLKNLTTRDLFELSTPTTQCEKVIGKCDFNTHCTCWLCGFPIFMDEKGNRVNDRKYIASDFYPECEHVLPVMQAVLILGGLYSSSQDKLYTAEKEKRSVNVLEKSGVNLWNYMKINLLPKEYKWSHRICNNTKRDAMFFNDSGNIVIEDIKNFLGIIYSNSDALKEVVKREYRSKSDWVTKQLENIQITLQPIVKYYKNNNTNLFLLSGVGNAVEFIERLPKLLPEDNSVRKFMEEWIPEKIEDYSRPFLTTHTIKNTVISNAFISNLHKLPIYYIIDHIKKLKTQNSDYSKRDKLVFYNFLFGTTYSHLSQFTEMDIKFVVYKYNFLSPSELLDIVFTVSSHFQDNNKSEPFLIDISYLIINTKLVLKILLYNAVPDNDFKTDLLNKINTSLIVLKRKDAQLTMYILKNVFDKIGIDIYYFFNFFLKEYEDYTGVPTLDKNYIQTFQNIENPEFGAQLLRNMSSSSSFKGGKHKRRKTRKNGHGKN